MKHRILAGIAVVLLASFTAPAFGQSQPQGRRSTPPKDIKKQIENTLARLDHSRISTGFLRNRAVPLVDLNKLSDAENGAPITLKTWRQIYFEMHNSALQTPNFAALQDFERRAERFKRSGVIPVGMLRFHYNEIKPDAVDRGLLLVENDQLIDVPESPESPYRENAVFAASALSAHTYADPQAFIFPQALYTTNQSSRPQRLEVNFDDGRGFQRIAFDQPISISYTSPGQKNIVVRAAFGEEVLESAFLFEKREFQSIEATDTPDVFWENLVSDYDYLGVFGEYDAYIFLGDGNTELTDPLIFVEGFDPDNAFGWPEIWDILNGFELAPRLIADGYDIVIMNFHNGADYVQRNGLALVSLIEKVNAEKTGNDQIAIAGASMGGLVGRYAMTYMETNGKDHNSRLFLTFDSPHQGANIPLGVQHWVEFFADHSAAAADQLVNLNSPASQQMLVYHFASEPNYTENSLKSDLLNDLASMGNYPSASGLRNVAVANGSGAGSAGGQLGNNDVPLNPGDQIIEWNYWSLFVAIDGNAWAVPDESPETRIFEGDVDQLWPFPDDHLEVFVSGTQPYDNAPGGKRDTQQQISDSDTGGLGVIMTDFPYHNFIPTVSALDIRDGGGDPVDLFYNINNDAQVVDKTPFEAVNFPTSTINEEHVEVTQANADFVVAQVQIGGSAPTPPADPSGLTATASGTSQIDLAWTDNSGNEDNFKIERHAGDGNFAEIATVGADVTSFGDTGLSASTTYTYRVRAANAAGNSGYSNAASATTDDPPSPPADPSGLTATANGTSQIDLAWTDNSANEDNFKIERHAGDGNFAEIATVGADVTSFGDTGLSASTTYTYRVRASNAAGNSGYSNEASATTDDPPPPPADPSGLTATANGTSQIDLAWTDNASNEDNFKIERHAGDGNFAEIATVGADVTSFGDTGLAASTTYTYRVRASNAAGNSGYSNEASATTDDPPPPPADPSGLTATANGSSQIDLAWTDNASDEDNFVIERHAGDGNFAEIATVGAGVTSFDDTGLAASTTYTYRVRAANAAGNSGYSNEASATTDDPGVDPNENLALDKPVTASSELSSRPVENAVDGDDGSVFGTDSDGEQWLRVDLEAALPVGRVIVKWTNDYFATDYEFQISDDDANWTTVYSTDAGAAGEQEFTFSQTTASYVRLFMTAANRSRYGIGELEVYAGDAPAGPPAAPSSLTATANGASQINLSWTDNSSNEDNFKIERHGGDGNFVEIATVGADVVSYNDTGLVASTTYTYRVRASNSAGNSGYSNEASATTDDPPPPPADPSGLTATANGSSQIDLSWTDNSGNEDNFKIERHPGDGNFAEIATVGADVVSYNDTGLSASTTYTYRVRAANAAGNSAYSNEASATTDDPPPPPADPSGLTATANGSSQIDLSWTDNSSNEDNFKIERHAGDGNFAEIATVGTDVTSYDDTGLSANTTYTYRVRASNGAGDSGYSNEASATTDEGGADPNVNLALDKPIAASNVFSSFAAENANDGDDGTSWGTKDEGNEEWLRVDLESGQTVGRAIVKWNGSRFAPDYELQVSDDDVNWTTVYATDAGAEGEQEFEFAQTTARYVRLYVLSFNVSAVAVNELEIYSGPAESVSSKLSTVNSPSSAHGSQPTVDSYALHQNYPNPFNPSTTIVFELPENEIVTLRIFDASGREVARLAEKQAFAAGRHALKFDARNLPSGIYLYAVTAGKFRQVRRMVLMK